MNKYRGFFSTGNRVSTKFNDSSLHSHCNNVGRPFAVLYFSVLSYIVDVDCRVRQAVAISISWRQWNWREYKMPVGRGSRGHGTPPRYWAHRLYPRTFCTLPIFARIKRAKWRPVALNDRHLLHIIHCSFSEMRHRRRKTLEKRVI